MAADLPISTGTILVVDDNPTNLQVLFDVLSDCGHRVAIAKSGEAALQRLESYHPDLILMDVMMPGLDGFETCQRLKQNTVTCHIPVMFMTALNQPADKVKGFQVGGVDYITKPIQTEETLARVHTHLQLNFLNRTLEQQVAERTAELSQALVNLQTAQAELIKSEKMAAIGQLTASIAHEVNTPLAVIGGASTNINNAFQSALKRLPILSQYLSAGHQAEFWQLVQIALKPRPTLSTKAERQQRRQLHDQLMEQGIHNAAAWASQLTLLQLKLEDLPNPAILNDLNGLNYLQAVYDIVMQQQSLNNIQQEVKRAAKIVSALKNYSHQDYTGKPRLAAVTDGLGVALILYQYRLKQGIELTCEYQPDLPQILCNPDELTQVWVNLIDNALYAMGAMGYLAITVTQQAEWVVVKVTDSGKGIPPEVQVRMFDPFFTTKPQGEGSGLGLDITQKIVQKHGGEIQVQSQPGRTSFIVQLPVPAYSCGVSR